MPRLTRLLQSGVATHVIQRGNNLQVIFFDDEDREQKKMTLTPLLLLRPLYFSSVTDPSS